jgi:hypothetical protein
MVASKAMLVKAVAMAATTAVAGAAAFLATSWGAAAAPVARAWIDNPLDGAVVAAGPVPITAHAYDPGGVADLVFVVDGEDQQGVVPDNAGHTLVNVTISWAPAGEASYVLAIYGRDRGGQRGLPGRVVVQVGTAPTGGPDVSATPTAGPTATPGPDASTAPPLAQPPSHSTTQAPSHSTTQSPQSPPPPSQPTSTTPKPPASSPPPGPPCTPPAPVLLEPAEGEVFTSENYFVTTFTWSGWRGSPPECPPSGFRIEVFHGRTVIADDLAASTTTWQPPQPLSCGLAYTWRVGSKRSDGSLANWSPYRGFSSQCIPA